MIISELEKVAYLERARKAIFKLSSDALDKYVSSESVEDFGFYKGLTAAVDLIVDMLYEGVVE
jgi:hypothetical protein